MQNKSRKNAVRTGFSFLELQVAFVLFGIALSGLVPLVVTQSRQLQKLESRCNDQTTHYLVPSSSAWARKLGAAATIQTEDPGPPAPPPVTLIDNGDPGYSETDTGIVDWQTAARPDAFQGSVRWNNGGNFGDKAKWAFAELDPGWYEVLVTFPCRADQASDAPYKVQDRLLFLETVRVDQTVPPSGGVFEGSTWQSLGVFSIASGTLRVELSDNADGNIMADAVRIVPVENIVQVISVEKSLGSEEVTAHVSITVQVP